MHCQVLTAFLLAAGAVAAEDAPDFDRQVAPILAERCLECHSGAEAKGKLDLSRAEAALAGGESGLAIEPGKPEASNLLQRIAANEMPPKHPLPPAEREILKAWVASGAKWGSDPIDPFRFTTATRAGYDWWSLQPLVAAPVRNPQSRHRNPIDTFIAEKLAEANLTPSVAADPRTLLRRIYFDLIGLPPSPEEVEEFVRAFSPTLLPSVTPSEKDGEKERQSDGETAALQAVVDRLLASPEYGERWARHWLDVAHFGESDGYEFDKMRPHAWRYRDWVIDALNRDLPYNEFAQLQIAGDVLLENDPSAIIATGFLAGGAHDGLMPKGEMMRQVMRQDELEDLVGLVCQSFLGLTANCARCHDHKFDPIRQTDYYRLAAALAGVKRGNRDVSVRAPSDLAEAHATAEKELGEVTEAARELELKNEVARLAGELDVYRKRQSYAVTPQVAPVIHRLKRGNVEQPAEAVAAGGIACLAASGADFGLPLEASDKDRRAMLTKWIASEQNPLFARTIVNRLWQYHFGQGLVETPSDLGFSGGQPSHPELLDFLARELIAQGWSLKAIHRLIVTSETYQQASRPRDECLAVDADNRLLWRYRPRRLEAEAIRDAMLVVSGQLNSQHGGPSYQDFRPYIYKTVQYYEPQDPIGAEFHRRSIYRFWARGGKNPLLDSFDCPDPSIAAPKRPATTTPLQALALMNNSFTLRMSEALAERLKHERPNDARQQVARAFALAYGRPHSVEQSNDSTDFVKVHGLSAFCRVLLNTNGFLYVE